MVAFVAAFLAGVCLFQFQTELPSDGWLLAFPLLALAALRWPRGRLAIALPAGFLWTLAWILWFGPGEYHPDWDGRDLVADGVIASLPEGRGDALRFHLRVDSLNDGGRAVSSPGLVRVSWHRPAARPRLGETWRLPLRLKPPRGFANPGGFDYEGWLFRAGIAATGYVTETASPERLATPTGRWRLAALREEVREGLESSGNTPRATATLQALTVGDRGGFDAALWELMRRTGTTHLMSISGLHVSMVAGLVFGALAWLWRQCEPLAQRLPAQHAGAWAGIAAAIAYSALAGFSVPTQRSLLMGGVAFGALLLRRAQRPTQVLALALGAVLLADPLAVLAVDFWLSFGAVAVILLAAAGRRPGSRQARAMAWGRVQLAITLAMAPVTLFLFQQVSLVSPFANLWAIPWFGLVVVPASLLGAAGVLVFPSLGAPLSDLAASAAEWGLAGLDAMAALPLAELHWPAPAWPAAGAAVLGALVLSLPRGVPGRAAGVALWLPLLWQGAEAVPPGHFRLTLLDVGQGMAAVVRTAGHALVYDLGPRLSVHFDATRAVVVPFLRREGIARLDALVLSNGDADHAGAPDALDGVARVTATYSGEPERFAQLAARRCAEGQAWEWDGVRFRFLNPADEALRGNDRSCVLQVEAGEGRLLLTGDVGAAVERRLVARWGRTLAATALQVPHHGSRTSSDSAFVKATAPQLALLSTGYRNRFGFPKADVVERWRAQGAVLLDTQAEGAITLEIGPGGLVGEPRLMRREQRRYWHRE